MKPMIISILLISMILFSDCQEKCNRQMMNSLWKCAGKSPEVNKDKDIGELIEDCCMNKCRPSEPIECVDACLEKMTSLCYEEEDDDDDHEDVY